MRRKTISTLLTIALVLSLFGGMSVTASAYTGIFDTFDSGTPGTAPEGWNTSGSVVISTDVSVSSSNSLKLQGASGNAVSAYKLIDVAPENATVEADVYCGDGDAGSLSLSEASGKWQARVLFKDEQICYSDTGHDDQNLHTMTTYTANTWYHVKIMHNYTHKTFDVYVDGTLIGDDIPMYTSGDPTPTKLYLSSGNDAGSRLIYFDNVRLYSSADTDAPAITGSTVWRSDAETASVRFSSDEAGTCWYQITESETPPADIISGGTYGGAVTADAAAEVALSGLTGGEKYVHLVVKDYSGNVSNALTISLPCDYYYHENFEAYPPNTYIASGDLSPLASRNSGSGPLDQKVIEDADGKKLSLTSLRFGASDQHILLDKDTLTDADTYVFEGDVYPLLNSFFQLRFSLTDGSYEGNHEAGVFFCEGKITTATQSGAVTLKDSYSANQWHHVVIAATPSENIYAVYVDDELLHASLPLPAGIDRLALSAGNWVTGTTAYYDNLTFYIAPSDPYLPVDYVFDISEGDVTITDGTNPGTYKVSFGDSEELDNIPQAQVLTLTGSGSSVVSVSATTGTVKLLLDGMDTSRNMVLSSSDARDVEIILADDSDNVIGDALVNMSGDSGGGLIIGCEHYDEPDHVCDEHCGTLTVMGNPSRNVAAISGHNITINGGNITATGGNNSPGIGRYGGTVKNITINGGNITAMGTGPYGAAGIGGGAGTDADGIRITGGVISATGSGRGAGIGAGQELSDGGNAYNITISGGTVFARSSTGPGIGGHQTSENFKFLGGSVNASSIAIPPANEDGTAVYLTTVTLFGVSGPTKVSDIVLTGADYYGTEDLFTDSQGRLYLYLPEGAVLNGVTAGGAEYSGSITTTNDGLAAATFASSRAAVTFNENDGETPAESTCYIAPGTSVFYNAAAGGSVIGLPAPERTGYVFAGWYKEAACTNQILDDTPALCAGTDYTDVSGLWTVDGDVTLYAKWLEKTPMGLGLDYQNEMITGLIPNAAYTIEGMAVTADADGKAPLDNDWFGTPLSVVKNAVPSDYSFDSTPAVINIPARPAAPTTPAGVDETSSGAGDGQITGVNDTMEYKLAAASDWTPVESGATVITGLSQGTYHVRYRAVITGSPAFAGDYAAVVVDAPLAHGVIQFESSGHGTYEGYNGWMIGVTRTGGTDGAVSVSYSMADGTAAAGTHYKTYSGTLTWEDGDSSRKVIPFTAYDDGVYHGSLTMTCILTNPAGGAVLGEQNTLNIQISDNDPPPAPEGLKAEAGKGKVSLSWNAVKDAYYKVYCAQTSDGFTEADLCESVYDGTSYTVSGLTNGKTYYFAVKAGHNIYYSDFSAVVSAVPTSGSSGGRSATKEDEQERIEIRKPDGNTVASGTVTDVENGVQISVASDELDRLESADQNVTLETDMVTVSFDEAAIDSIDSDAGLNEVILEIVRVDSASLLEEIRERIGNRPVYSFSLSSGGNAIPDFGGGTATVRIPYTLASGEDPNAVVVYYVDGTGNLIPVNGRYDTETQTAIFTTEHFSVYAIGYNYISFADVAEDAWYYNAVTFLAAREVTNGTTIDTFSPDIALTRGQCIVLLMRACGIEPDENPGANFSDAGDMYYTGYLAAAKRLDISNGVGNNRFAPDSEITRQELFTLLYRALTVLGRLPQETVDSAADDFTDAGEISDYALTAMNTLIKTGLVSGNNRRLEPLSASTRAQMAQVLYNLLSR